MCNTPKSSRRLKVWSFAYVVLAVAMVSCRQALSDPAPSSVRDPAPSSEQTAALLVQKIQTQGRGTATVGFKEAGQARGVDPKGQVLVHADTVQRMVRELVARGFTIVDQFQLIPAVVVTMPPGDANAVLDAVAALLRHPNIDYVEANTQGRRG